MQFRHGRSALLAFASTGALFAASAALAQTTQPQVEDTTEVDEIVVTGTRAVGRTRLDTIAPVDVITGETLTRTGTGTETAAALAAAAPSINFPRPAISDGSDHVRPATLRGLAPDQTLVLINGQRGHVGALVNVNGALGRGSTAFDLNTIPSVTLGTVEVLRDGASAQYGADAIAGVINLRLREADSGGGITVNYGIYDTEFTTARGSHSRSDGEQTSVSGWVGLPLFGDGFLTLSGELQQRDPTNRSDYADPGAVRGGSSTTVIGRFGDPETEAASAWFNAGAPLGNGWDAYAFGGYQHRDSSAAATARAFNNGNNIQSIYPDGFLPIIATSIDDYNLYGGVRSEAAGFTWDIAAGYGRNELVYEVRNSLNASLGPSSPTSFDAGGLGYDQFTFSIDAVRPVEAGLYEPLNLALGVEYRREIFDVQAGEPDSYRRGTGGTASAGAGSQGFPGFQPSNEVDEDRSNISAYIDVEGRFSEQFTLGVAARYEDYSDFGDTLTGKMSARFDFSDAFALRGAISTGFKAPALQQQFFSYIATNLVATAGGVVLQQNASFRVDDPVAILLGAKPLEPERSTNYSAGAVLRRGGFELTVDAYRIDLADRIIYSETLGVARPSQTTQSTNAIATLLAPLGVSGARFFLNGVDTTTSGLDIVARYRTSQDFGRFDFTLAANLNKTEVTKTPPVPANLAIAPSPDFLFDRASRLAFEEGTPEQKIVGSVDWSLGGWAASAKATSYDSVLVANNNPATNLNYSTGSAVLVDLEGRYSFPFGVTAAVGVNNLTDEYPNFTPTALNGVTGSVGFPSFSPYGFNGRFLYGRLSYSF